MGLDHQTVDSWSPLCSRLETMPTTPRPSGDGRRAWTSMHFSYAALALNGLGLVVLFANLLSGNSWWETAIAIALGCFALGGLSALRARILRTRERRVGG